MCTIRDGKLCLVQFVVVSLECTYNLYVLLMIVFRFLALISYFWNLFTIHRQFSNPNLLNAIKLSYWFFMKLLEMKKIRGFVSCTSIETGSIVRLKLINTLHKVCKYLKDLKYLTGPYSSILSKNQILWFKIFRWQ